MFGVGELVTDNIIFLYRTAKQPPHPIMKKMQRKQNNKKKTKDTNTISHTPALSTILLGGELESLRLSRWSQTMSDTVASAVCKGIDDFAFSGPGNSLSNDDYHAWCIDDEGLVCDYSSAQLVKQSNHRTGDIIRRPFTAHAISQMLTHCNKIYDAFLQGIAAQFGGGDIEADKKALLSIIDTPLFPSRNCYICAKLLHDSNPKKYSLAIGSLGFRQLDGRIYWECG